jgi:hypothetical protein
MVALVGCKTDQRGFEVVRQYSIGMGYGLYIQDHFLYATTNDGAEIFDIENPEKMRLLEKIDIDIPCFTVIVHNNTAFLGGETGFTVVDVSEVGNSEVLSNYKSGGAVYNLSLRGNYVYSADLFKGLEIIDISDLAKPVRIGNLEVGEGSRDHLIIGDILYLANVVRGLMIVDIADPARPSLLGIVDESQGARSLFVDTDTLYLGTYNNGVRIFDIADPKNPKYVGSFLEPEEINVFHVRDRIFYGSRPEKGVTVLDIRHFQNPVELAYFKAGTGHENLYHDGLVYSIGKKVSILRLLP